jgi:hypothetical protein
LKNSTGDSSGSVTCQNVRNRPAPSSAAASNISAGICLSPARKITIGAPNCQAANSTKVPSAVDGSAIQLLPPMPTSPSRPLIAPALPNRVCHTMAIATLPPRSDGT